MVDINCNMLGRVESVERLALFFSVSSRDISYT